MKRTAKTALRALLMPFLLTTLTTIGMEQKLQTTQKPPLIKVELYPNPTKPAFYMTPQQKAHLNQKGITSFTIPIGREVDKVIVREANGSYTNWKEHVPQSIRQYELRKIKNKPLSFDQRLKETMAIDMENTFPSILPVELFEGCSNESKRSFKINGVRVQAVLKSDKSFHQEQNKCLDLFYKKAASNLSDTEKATLVANGTLIPTIKMVIIPGLIFPLPIIKHKHGPNGCPNQHILEQKLIQKKTVNQNNIANYIRGRENGTLRKKPLPTIQSREDILRHYEQLEQKNMLTNMAQKQPQPKCVHPSKCMQVDIDKNICPQKDTEIIRINKHYINKSEYGRYISECTLLMSQKQPQPNCVHASKCIQVDILNKAIRPQEDTEIFCINTDRHGNECTLL